MPILVVLTVAFKSSSRLQKFQSQQNYYKKSFENNINVRFDQISKHSKKISNDEKWQKSLDAKWLSK